MAILHSLQFGYGNPKTIVFLGSIGSTARMWTPQLDAFAPTHHVIALDHRGHGGSKVIDKPCTIQDMANDVLDTLDALGVRHFGVVGLSLGGAVAQYLAANSERVTRSVLMCTSANFADPEVWAKRIKITKERGTKALADDIVARWFTPNYTEQHLATVDLFRRMLANTDDTGYIRCCEALADFDFSDQLSSISAPVLAIAGANDEGTPPAELEAIADNVGGPSMLQVISPGSHILNVEAASDVNRLLRRHFVV
ncbi:3-oxoadipate enol-lactonase [Corynebacterium pseudopelargi]|uniref:3-oxoadipate enol-lactonase 2 n=1 Tax=Corynebacterium pseudopelargi TaxID=2080757 RepID=A0A3G6IS63_9CORY|nr:3-oxoadipate enol-lactonase [Corynebacterium pseudopelargi]AZA08465.1 3-oxoadipate enol-lactonase 2 [Corynebacterium pseudopelargi]